MYIVTRELATKDAPRSPLLTARACTCARGERAQGGAGARHAGVDVLARPRASASHPREELQRQIRPPRAGAARDERRPRDEVPARHFVEHPPRGVEEAAPGVGDDEVVAEEDVRRVAGSDGGRVRRRGGSSARPGAIEDERYQPPQDHV